jgi:hypothetical protein
VHFDFPFGGADPAHRQQIRHGKEWFPLFSFGIHRVDKLITALPLIPDLKGLLFGERRMDKEACGASGFEHWTVARVLWQKGTLGLAARPHTNPGPERVGKEPYFHPWNYRIECVIKISAPKAGDQGQIIGDNYGSQARTTRPSSAMSAADAG